MAEIVRSRFDRKKRAAVVARLINIAINAPDDSDAIEAAKALARIERRADTIWLKKIAARFGQSIFEDSELMDMLELLRQMRDTNRDRSMTA